MSKLRRFLGIGLLASLGTAMAVFSGCSSDSDDSPGGKKDAGADAPQGDGSTVDVKANCELVGQSCAAHSDCCSANCDPKLNSCVNPVGACKTAGNACSAATECCTLVCSGGTCGEDLCVSDQGACTGDDQCCSGQCGDAGCVPLNTSCKTSGNSCGAGSECCSQICTNGSCSAKVSFCTQTGDVCADDKACCAGICSKQGGAKLGVCKQPSAPGTTGCLVAGEVCDAIADGGTTNDAGLPSCGGACCSRACAPYGPTGVLVCQPPSGCRPTGEVCVGDADCCGSAGLPGGNGSVKCSKGSGEPVGRCDNGNACRPAGAVCKLANGSCNAENNCCAGNVNQDPSVCQQDLLGIPRCTGVGNCADAGALEGTACATSADCCGQPCLPNNASTSDGGSPFVCGGSSCVPSGSACTTDADCCSGLPCKAPPGSTQGVCGPPPVIPDAGPDAGYSCSLYGQDCSSSADCCNSVPCTNGKCLYPVPR